MFTLSVIHAHHMHRQTPFANYRHCQHVVDDGFFLLVVKCTVPGKLQKKKRHNSADYFRRHTHARAAHKKPLLSLKCQKNFVGVKCWPSSVFVGNSMFMLLSY